MFRVRGLGVRIWVLSLGFRLQGLEFRANGSTVLLAHLQHLQIGDRTGLSRACGTYEEVQSAYSYAYLQHQR